MNEQVLLTVDQAAERLRLSRALTYRLVLSGTIASIKVGRARRVPVDALARFVEQRLLEADPNFDLSKVPLRDGARQGGGGE